MDARKAQKIISDFLYLMNSIRDTYDYNMAYIGTTNDETNDLLHEIELASLDAVELSRTARRLKEVRKERRKYTNENRYLKHVKDFRENNLPFITEVKQLAFRMNNVTETLKAEVYTPKVNMGLKLCREQGVS